MRGAFAEQQQIGQSQAQTMEKDRKKIADLSEQNEALNVNVHKTVTERNSLKAKYASVAKDLGRLTKGNRSVKEIEGVLAKYENLAVQNSVLKAERNQALDDVKEYKMSSEILVDSRRKAGVVGEAEKALQVKGELERIISSLTETVQTKEMQIGTMRDVNRQLAGELAKEREKGEEGESLAGTVSTSSTEGEI